jgi:hypothetical protein
MSDYPKMNFKQTVISFVFGALVMASATTGFSRDLCNREGMTTNITACLNINSPSDYQKSGLDDLIKARFCGKGDLARDGMFRCRGDDPEAVKNIMGCGAPAMLELVTNLIPENDPRKPASCN